MRSYSCTSSGTFISLRPASPSRCFICGKAHAADTLLVGLARLHDHLKDTGVMKAVGTSVDVGRFLGQDEGLVEPPPRLVIEEVGEYLAGGEVLVSGGSDVVDGTDRADLADAAQ